MGSPVITLTKYGVEFEVEYYADKGHAGTYWEPPEPPELYIEVVRVGGQDITELLDDTIIEGLNDKLFDVLARADEDCYV